MFVALKTDINVRTVDFQKRGIRALTILAIILIFLLALFLILIFSLLKAASMADRLEELMYEREREDLDEGDKG